MCPNRCRKYATQNEVRADSSHRNTMRVASGDISRPHGLKFSQR